NLSRQADLVLVVATRPTTGHTTDHAAAQAGAAGLCAARWLRRLPGLLRRHLPHLEDGSGRPQCAPAHVRPPRRPRSARLARRIENRVLVRQRSLRQQLRHPRGGRRIGLLDHRCLRHDVRRVRADVVAGRNDHLLRQRDWRHRHLDPGGARGRRRPPDVGDGASASAGKKFDCDSADKRQVVGIVGPALSPDAKQVAFEALNQIWLMEIGKKPRPITADTYYKCDPAWSADGTKLAYSTDKSGIMKVYVYDVRTGRGDETPVTTFGGAQVSAAWSRDGSK